MDDGPLPPFQWVDRVDAEGAPRFDLPDVEGAQRGLVPSGDREAQRISGSQAGSVKLGELSGRPEVRADDLDDPQSVVHQGAGVP